ncbi:MAG: ATP-binding cassette domain-containing protein [Phascolarctobacterium sp.]|nr:ATP-binding cassette domain-containing protein [Phascolarctobacterium sp.]MDO4920374.1 ATP-binding cassette domain-containing protein [Phascolarctobacterium sp.]
MAIIKAEGVSIRYLTGDFKNIGLKEYVVRRLKGNYRVTEFWADKNITFALGKGDMLGIIGTNGAGKSTLLKAVSGIMVPTEGHMEINGTVAALLELASGFDGDLTVRENTYLRGALLGYTRKFMEEQYDAIIAFAELQDFQDRLFKQLSSGMKSRLAFAIACLVKPDILILDEVLSVGDGAFRKKSGDKMKEILAGGVTGILVSHSLGQVRELCNKILWLDHGKQIAFTNEVTLYCDAYEEFLATKKLPKSEAEIKQLAEGWRKRQQRKREEAARTEAQKLQAVLEKGESKAALEAALAIVKKQRPELLKEYAARQ